MQNSDQPDRSSLTLWWGGVIFALSPRERLFLPGHRLSMCFRWSSAMWAHRCWSKELHHRGRSTDSLKAAGGVGTLAVGGVSLWNGTWDLRIWTTYKDTNSLWPCCGLSGINLEVFYTSHICKWTKFNVRLFLSFCLSCQMCKSFFGAYKIPDINPVN